MLSDILVMKGLLTDEQVKETIEEFGDTKTMERNLVQKGFITEKDYSEALASSLGLPFMSISDMVIPEEILGLLSDQIIRKHQLLPLGMNDGKLVVAMSDPTNIIGIDDVMSITGYEVKPVVVTYDELENMIARYIRNDDELSDLTASMDDEVDDSEALNTNDLESDEPIVRFVNLMVTQAIQDRASDIHIEPQQNGVSIRYRIDGVLHEMQSVPKATQDAIISRLKIISNINIAEKRKPQDGRMTVNYNGKAIDLRVATLPTVWGENVVMRILYNNATTLGLKDMLMSDHNYQIFSNSLKKPHGMILVTGPTGSGKALKLDTRIPTPNGFTTMGKLKVGDTIFDSKMQHTKVTSLSEINNKPELYKVTLSDGQEIFADVDHQWIVASHNSRNRDNTKKVKASKARSYNGQITASKLDTISKLYDDSEYITLNEALEVIKSSELDEYIPSKSALLASLRFMDAEVERYIDSKGIRIIFKPSSGFKALSERIKQRYNYNEKPVLITMSTGEIIAEGLEIGGRSNFSIPLVENNIDKDIKLPIDPYVLGAWLGDGSTGSGSISSGYLDYEEMYDNLKKAWRGSIKIRKRENGVLFTLSKKDENSCIRGHSTLNDKVSCGKPNLHYGKDNDPVNPSLGQLLALNKLRGFKHIPEIYFNASRSQRMELLKGLMDTDGSISKSGNQSLGFSNERLSYDAIRLIRSLGFKAKINRKKAGYKTAEGDFKRCKDAFSISFNSDENVFKLKRKSERTSEKISKANNWIYIKNVELVSKIDPNYGPVRCITVDSEDHSYLCEDYVITHNSTTLYTALNAISSSEIKVITVEDPVEYRIPGINQVQVNTKAGMTFQAALRSILRSDPDVVLVGEIRDTETAKISIEASLTGHLVLSTLHTNDAPSTVTRLTEMGIEPFLVGSALECVVAQRLARRLCEKCKKETTLSQDYIDELGAPITTEDIIFEPVGCSSCSNTGYRGRVALHEIMYVSEEIEKLAVNHASSADIKEQAIKENMTTLKKDGWIKVTNGITSVKEVLRVVS